MKLCKVPLIDLLSITVSNLHQNQHINSQIIKLNNTPYKITLKDSIPLIESILLVYSSNKQKK